VRDVDGLGHEAIVEPRNGRCAVDARNRKRDDGRIAIPADRRVADRGSAFLEQPAGSTRVTNVFSVRARFENSAAVYTVGLTFRPTVRVTRSSAPKTSPYVRLSLTIIRSMSLADWSVALATEP
jgi:hypothetical protein